MDTLLIKTEQARLALQPGTRTLSPKERALVLLANGRRSAQELLDLVAGAAPGSVESLMERGFLTPVSPTDPLPSQSHILPAAPDAEAAEPLPAAAPDRTSLGWTRSPAATKLYLMDLAERTFARSDVTQWEFLRDLLREVRDDESLKQAMGLVTQAIGRAAGEDRAELIRRQLLRA